jgi:hypothetical protein
MTDPKQKLSHVLPEIPTNVNLAKKLPGIGATHMEIHNKRRNSIIIEPNVPVIQGKCRKHNKEEYILCGVYEGKKTEDVVDYLSEEREYYKIMTTPESLPKVFSASKKLNIDLFNEWFCLMDESHLLVKDVDYREDIVLPMSSFFQFQNKALVSATPIELSDPRFKEQGFELLEVVANYEYRYPITVMHTNNPFIHIREIIKKAERPICFFINLVDYCYSVIKELGIENESSIFCAPKSQMKIKHDMTLGEDNGVNVYDEWREDRMNKYNFFSARFFSAFDMDLEYKPDVVMVTDVKKSVYTILDINTDCVQIAGRLRGGFNSLTHILTTDDAIASPKQSELEETIKLQENAYNYIRTLYDNAPSEIAKKILGDTMRSNPFTKLIFPSGAKNYFAIDNYINEYLVKGLYQDYELIREAYMNSDMFIPKFKEAIIPYTEEDRLVIKRANYSVKQKRMKIVEILSKFELPYNEYDMIFIDEARHIDPLIVEAFELLGKEAIEETLYSSHAIQEAVILAKQNGDATLQLIRNSFRCGRKYKNTEITKELSRIYDLLKIYPTKTVRGETILQYFHARPCQIGKKRNRGYYLSSER